MAIAWPPKPILPVADLHRLALERLDDGRTLLAAGRPAGAVYVAGYAIELTLKARICRVLGWTGFPGTASAFPSQLRSFQTHDLEVLLILSGADADVKSRHFADWSLVRTWKPDMRYSTGVRAVADPVAFLEAVERLLPDLA